MLTGHKLIERGDCRAEDTPSAASAKMSIATLDRSKITSSPCDAAVSPARLSLTNDDLSRVRH